MVFHPRHTEPEAVCLEVDGSTVFPMGRVRILCVLLDTLLNKLQGVQNTAASIITRTTRHHITSVLKELNYFWSVISTIKSWFILLKLRMDLPQSTWRIWYNSIFPPCTKVTNIRVTCHTKSQNNNIWKSFFPKVASSLWNQFPQHIKDSQTLLTCN